MDIALFDLDSTLLPIDSDHSWGSFTQQLGWVDGQAFQLQNDAFYQDYKQQTLNVEAYVEFTTRAIREKGMVKALEAREQFMREIICPHMQPKAVDLVRKHMDAGDVCVMVTATNRFVVEDIAKAFGFSHLIATELEVDENGEFTGRIYGTPSFREGKVVRVQAWLAQNGLAWENIGKSYFYSDSINDLPLLEKVSHPVATNPDEQLEAIARLREWPILRLFE